jgi:hypothetical protein
MPRRRRRVVAPGESETPTSAPSVPPASEPRHLLAPGSLGVLGQQLAVNGRPVCLYEYGNDAVRYFSPSLSGASVPVGSGTDTWAEFLHADDKGWLLDLHRRAVAHGLGYEALFRFVKPGAPALWVVDRQERIGTRAHRAWGGVSLEVTDLLVPMPAGTVQPSPISLAIYCVSRRDTARRPKDDGTAGLRSDLVGLPLTAADIDAVLVALDERAAGTTTVQQTTRGGRRRDSLFSWAPFGDDATSPLIALAVADVSEHIAASSARRRRLHALAHAAGGANFRLVPGGRARVRREWLQQLDPQIGSYSDLLDRAQRAQVRQQRAARRTAMQCLEGYCVTLTLDLGGRTMRVVEAGLPDASGDTWDCVLVPLASATADAQLKELAQLTQAVRLDPAAQLLRSLGHGQTVAEAMALLVRVGPHEAHVRRRLSMVRGDADPGTLARRYSHTLAEPHAE